jgi:hypothetical protein
MHALNKISFNENSNGKEIETWMFFCVNVHKSYESGQNLLHYLRWMGKSCSQGAFLIDSQMTFISCSKNMVFIIPLIYYQKCPCFSGLKL